MKPSVQITCGVIGSMFHEVRLQNPIDVGGQQTAVKYVKIFVVWEFYPTQCLEYRKTWYMLILSFPFLLIPSTKAVPEQSRHLFPVNSPIWCSFLLKCPFPCLLVIALPHSLTLGFYLANSLLLLKSYLKGLSSKMPPRPPSSAWVRHPY